MLITTQTWTLTGVDLVIDETPQTVTLSAFDGVRREVAKIALMELIQDGRIQPGHVLVMRGAGVRGGPAMGGGASRVVFAVDGAGLGDKIAILTDGHLSGLVCKGLVVAELSPEAATGGPLALVQDGDSITIDLDTRRSDVYRRGADGLWVLHPFDAGDDVLLASVDLRISATTLFAEVEELRAPSSPDAA